MRKSDGRDLSPEPMKLEKLSGERLPLVGHGESHDEVRRSKWYHTCFVIMAEVMGAGVLSLPHATARLGLVLGVASSLVGGAAATFSGFLLARTKHDLGQDDAESYHDLALALGGSLFGRLTRWAVLLNWASLLPYFLLACADSLQNIATVQLPKWQWILLAAALLAVPLQLRTLHQISWLALPSSLAVIASIGVIIATLAHHHATLGGAPMPAWPAAHSTPLTISGDLSAFVFAYMGHSMYLEMMREMENSRHFAGAALPIATLVMTVTYTSTAVLGLWAYGTSVSDFLPDSMPIGAGKSLVGVLLAFHTLVSYLVTGQPLHRAFHNAFFPGSAEADTPRAACDWLLITLTQLGLSALLAIVIPYFGTLQGLLGALSGAPFIFGYPAFFFLRASQVQGKRVSVLDGTVCALYLCVFTPFLMICGTINAVDTIVTKWSEGHI